MYVNLFKIILNSIFLHDIFGYFIKIGQSGIDIFFSEENIKANTAIISSKIQIIASIHL